MSRTTFSSPCPNHTETVWGFAYLAFQLLFLPSLLFSLNVYWKISSAELNFVFFFLNFMAIVCIFGGFLGRSARVLRQQPIRVIQAVVLGAAAYFACTQGVKWIIGLLAPGFVNANDASLAAMGRSSRFLIAFATVILVPPVEECLYRGLIFRNLYGKNPTAAYIISIAAFAAIHILGYLGTYSPLELCMAVLQYLPAGLCLAWAYTKAGTIFAPIVIHAVVNAVGIYRMR